MMKKVIFLAVVSLAAAGCASTSGTTNSTAPAATDAEFNKLVSQAENEIKLANQSGFLWTKTEGFLKDAKDAKAKGDMDTAMKKVKSAIKEAQLAQQQAKDQAKAKAPF
jgi:type IV pilus biogenesis protein CpaD/CtpE